MTDLPQRNKDAVRLGPASAKRPPLPQGEGEQRERGTLRADARAPSRAPQGRVQMEAKA